ncbi:hypothetical protein C8R48DRAFT_708351 [Suillus tomentosus]|nr:hypothetical protein C8R48DRAFT_708351 [Suillus tomentosus]
MTSMRLFLCMNMRCACALSGTNLIGQPASSHVSTNAVTLMVLPELSVSFVRHWRSAHLGIQVVAPRLTYLPSRSKLEMKDCKSARIITRPFDSERVSSYQSEVLYGEQQISMVVPHQVTRCIGFLQSSVAEIPVRAQ